MTDKFVEDAPENLEWKSSPVTKEEKERSKKLLLAIQEPTPKEKELAKFVSDTLKKYE